MGKDWKTTLVGVAGAVALGLTAYLEQHGVTSKDMVNIVILAALGYFSKSVEAGK